MDTDTSPRIPTKGTDDQMAGDQMTGDGPNAQTLARDMIDVHGTEASVVARGNARTAALAGQPDRARSWLRPLGMIPQHQAANRSAHRGPGNPPPPPLAATPVRGSS